MVKFAEKVAPMPWNGMARKLNGEGIRWSPREGLA